ncbi:MAG: cell division protein ZapA [Christensenellales bacterium]|jgi:cell division protein ZapA (FtsZ GTPase activity inhibitor)
MSKKKAYTLTLLGQRLEILSSDTEEHVLKVATIVNNRLSELSSGSSGLTSTALALVVALQLAEENVVLKNEVDRIRKKQLEQNP